MNWKMKARVQNAVAALPFLSNDIYYAIQRTVGGLRSAKIDPFARMKAAAGMVEWAGSAGFDISGKTILEVGTGHMIDLPTGLWLCGAKRIITVDLNPYLRQVLVAEAREVLRQKRDQVRRIFEQVGGAGFDERLDLLTGTDIPDSELLDAMHVTYMSPADATRLPLDASSIDMHVSHTVFEHIPLAVLSGILAEAKRILRTSGIMIHNIDPSDHFSHEDASITRINFLQFSEEEWASWGGNRFMYHNRLRADDYIRLFEESGVEIIREERVVDERSLSALKSGFPLSPRFAGIDPEVLATTSLAVMGRFR